MRMAKELHWLQSVGGPWILMPSGRAKSWLGGLGRSVTLPNENDYTALCQIMTDPSGRSTYLAPLEGSSLGIGEMALGLTILDVNDVPCLVEWFGADSDDHLADRLNAGSKSTKLAETSFYVDTTSEYDLFDSAFSFAMREDFLSLQLRAGLYIAQAELINLADGEFAVTRLLLQ